MLTRSACEREVEQLHALFVRWYCGRADESEFERIEHALGESFELVGPDGSVNDRETVLDWLRRAYDTKPDFEIEIRNVEPVFVTEERALVRYEEWQSTPTGETGRISTALFESVTDPWSDDSGEPAVQWQYLQETWLDEPA